MTWWGWLILSIYLAGIIIATPRIGYVVAHDLAYHDRPLRGNHVAMGRFFGFFISTLWPIVFPAYRWRNYAKARGITGDGILIAPRGIRREQRLKQQEARIQELERELGIR